MNKQLLQHQRHDRAPYPYLHYRHSCTRDGMTPRIQYPEYVGSQVTSTHSQSLADYHPLDAKIYGLLDFKYRPLLCLDIQFL